MHKTSVRTRNSRHSSYDLHGDIEKIKAALSEASEDVRGRANEIFIQSLENAKEKTIDLEENISEYVAHNTLKSLGLALLAGAVIGFILRK